MPLKTEKPFVPHIIRLAPEMHEGPLHMENKTKTRRVK